MQLLASGRMRARRRAEGSPLLRSMGGAESCSPWDHRQLRGRPSLPYHHPYPGLRRKLTALGTPALKKSSRWTEVFPAQALRNSKGNRRTHLEPGLMTLTSGFIQSHLSQETVVGSGVSALTVILLSLYKTSSALDILSPCRPLSLFSSQRASVRPCRVSVCGRWGSFIRDPGVSSLLCLSEGPTAVSGGMMLADFVP